MKTHSLSTHHYANGGVVEVLESKKQCCSQIQLQLLLLQLGGE